jgi:hypothetical protein
VTKDIRGADLTLASLAARIGQFLDGTISREEAHGWFERAHASMATACDSRLRGCATPALVALLREMLAPDGGAPDELLAPSLARIEECINDLASRPGREILPPCLGEALRASRRVQLAVLKRPDFLPDAVRDQWADIGWRSAADGRIFLIPLCILTRDQFRRRIPDVLSGLRARDGVLPPDEDTFPYHPENDQASLLREAFPELTASGPVFEYWIDGAGLAEVVLDAPRIGRDEVLFATRLFCLRNGVRRATLDGRRISWARVPSR